MNNEKSKLIKELWQKAEKTLYTLYGDMPDLRILNRFYSEKMAFGCADAIILWDLVASLSCEALYRDYNVRLSGTVASSFAAYLLGASVNNPLPLHYHCSNCGSTEFVEKHDTLPFDIPNKTCACGAVMHPDGFDIPYEMIYHDAKTFHSSAWVSPKFASEAKRMVFEEMKKYYCVGELTTEAGYTRYAFLPQAYGEHFTETVSVTDDKYYTCMSLTIGSNPVFEKAERLGDKTGTDFYEIYASIEKNYLSDERIIREFANGNTRGIAYFDLQKEGFANMKEALKLAAPKSTYEILKVWELLDGTGTWTGNAKTLIASGVGITGIPATVEEVFMLLRDKFQREGYTDAGIAYNLTKKICYGRLDANSRLILSSLDLSEWFLPYVEKINYTFPKAHADSIVREALAFMWFKIHYPKEFEDICIGEI